MRDPVITDLVRHAKEQGIAELTDWSADRLRTEYLRTVDPAEAAGRSEKTIALADEIMRRLHRNDIDGARAALGHMLEAAAQDYAAQCERLDEEADARDLSRSAWDGRISA